MAKTIDSRDAQLLACFMHVPLQGIYRHDEAVPVCPRSSFLVQDDTGHCGALRFFKDATKAYWYSPSEMAPPTIAGVSVVDCCSKKVLNEEVNEFYSEAVQCLVFLKGWDGEERGTLFLDPFPCETRCTCGDHSKTFLIRRNVFLSSKASPKPKPKKVKVKATKAVLTD